MNVEAITTILDAARSAGREFLLETEGVELLGAMGLDAPAQVVVANAAGVDGLDLSAFPGDRVVIKVLSADIQHKSDVGGVAVVAREADAIREAVATMARSVSAKEPDAQVDGFTINECVAYEKSLGHELILGLRWNDDLGPVAVFGPGGIYTEFLSKNFAAGRDVAVLSPHLGTDRNGIAAALSKIAVTPILTAGLRGQPPVTSLDALVDIVERFQEVARAFMPGMIAEIEVNPFVVSGDRLVPLDILVRLGTPVAEGAPARPIDKIDNLLHPKSVALVGVSDKGKNPGRIILDNLVAGGFDTSRLYVIKPDTEEIAGVRCVPDPESLPETVDLVVLSIAAAAIPEIVTRFTEARKAESMIVIPGGMEEKAGTQELVARMHTALRASRETDWRGPVINGGNCLGIQSKPGNYDTLFIPRYKLPVPRGEAAPMALISQSGAYMVTNLDRLGGIVPRYAVSAGNQTDLTMGDYLTYLKDDPSIRVFACYVEGFKPLDGLAFMKAAAEITASGRTVMLYRAGRTSAGAKASASHTASLAGDYKVTRAVAEQAGILVTETLGEFADLMQLFALIGDKVSTGNGLGAISNAGFECVGIADGVTDFEMVSFAPETDARLNEVLKEARIDSIVDVHNPLDLTPMSNDEVYAHAIEAVMADPNVDVGVVGVVPLTPALQTLCAGEGHREDLTRAEGIAQRMAALKDSIAKPWVAVVDGGERYDAFARLLQTNGVPTFRTADRAVRHLQRFVAEQKRVAGL